MRLSRSAALAVGVALAVSACSSGAVPIATPDPAGPVLERCDHLGNQVPDRLDGLRARKTHTLEDLEERHKVAYAVHAALAAQRTLDDLVRARKVTPR